MPLDKTNIDKDHISYSSADVKRTKSELICGWLTFHEYASKLEIDNYETFTQNALNGEYGPIEIHPKTREKLLIWPSEYSSKSKEELPEPGTYKVGVNMEVAASSTIELDPRDTQNFIIIQQQFLNIAHSLGEIEEVQNRSNEMLYRSCFILRWVAFESFLRESVFELYKSNPKKVLSNKMRKKNTVTYEELLLMSNEFNSAELLLQNLIEKEIQLQESEGKSIHGLINFLKDEFLDKQDPYVSSYVFKGERKKTHYNDLMMFKDTRNVLMHDAGYYSPVFNSLYPEVPVRDGMVVITENFYLKSQLIIDSVAHKISVLINKELKQNHEG
ncbi:hypothetical protein C0Q44_26230 [Paenibacillus sp. PCH8]|uniref:hypothetical protein n=1 Tax=Paenibacillus sp. PCH8 TaxID=2066524 RepID=UPI000CF9EE20|nr:hypothetical protein [Paenibacillus sp. PCH8]PQP80728.1 hypothetical protein C0Q44_26230 [Paenibacillus sp. PCH8]